MLDNLLDESYALGASAKILSSNGYQVFLSNSLCPWELVRFAQLRSPYCVSLYLPLATWLGSFLT